MPGNSKNSGSGSGPGSGVERRMESIIAVILQVGVALSALIVLTGGFFYLVRHGLAYPDYRVFRGEPSDLRNLRGIVAEVAALRSRGIIQLGLIVLIATPVMRVVFSVFAFMQQRDRLYVLVTLIVLITLLISLTGALK